MYSYTARSCYNVTDFQPVYVSTSTTALSANPAVAMPLLTINGWILMQRKVTGGAVSFTQEWIEYRDGFGSSTGNDNYWLGLDKIYRLQQFGNVRLRIEVYIMHLSSLNSCISLISRFFKSSEFVAEDNWSNSTPVSYTHLTLPTNREV